MLHMGTLKLKSESMKQEIPMMLLYTLSFSIRDRFCKVSLGVHQKSGSNVPMTFGTTSLISINIVSLWLGMYLTWYITGTNGIVGYSL